MSNSLLGLSTIPLKDKSLCVCLCVSLRYWVTFCCSCWYLHLFRLATILLWDLDETVHHQDVGKWQAFWKLVSCCMVCVPVSFHVVLTWCMYVCMSQSTLIYYQWRETFAKYFSTLDCKYRSCRKKKSEKS